MESTDARRAFPCWDEPELKATFEVTLVVDDALAAYSNGSVVEERPEAGGKRRVRFAPTMVMSTYLVAFIVGPLEATDPLDVDGVPLRIVHPPGQGPPDPVRPRPSGPTPSASSPTTSASPTRPTSSTWWPSPTSPSGPWRTWAA